MAGDRDMGPRRARLLAAAVELACALGGEAVTVAQVSERAGVPAAAFAEHFADPEECLLAALAEIHAAMLEEVRRAVRGRPAKAAAPSAIAAQVRFAEQHAVEARFAMGEAMAAGARVLDARDRAVAEIARVVEEAHLGVNEATPIPALAGEVLIGATQRVLARRLRRAEPVAPAAELLGWALSYAEPARERRWATLARPAPSPRPPSVGELALRLPPRPRAERAGSPAREESQRLWIVLATALVISGEGFQAASVAEITRVAGVERRVFYELFLDKRAAFRAAHELAFQRTMEVTAGAYFSASEWPRRVWQAGCACTEFLQRNPVLARASIVHGQAGGPDTLARVDELLDAFTIFLLDGYEQPHAAHGAPPPLALEAIAQANLEIVYRAVRAGASPAITPLLPRLAYVSLAPFLGARCAAELIEEMDAER